MLTLDRGCLPCPPITDFDTFFKRARRSRGRHVVSLSLLGTSEAGTPADDTALGRVPVTDSPSSHRVQFSVIASKKAVSKKAVLRNRAKRRLRAAVQIVLNEALETTRRRDPADRLSEQTSSRATEEDNVPEASVQGVVFPRTFAWALMAGRSSLDCAWEDLLDDVRSQWAKIDMHNRQNLIGHLGPSPSKLAE